MNPVTSNAVYDKLYENAGTYYDKVLYRPSGGWTINSSGHIEVSSADLTIANVPAGVYLAWLSTSGDVNTQSGADGYCYGNNIARQSTGFQSTGWGETFWPSCIYKHAGGNVVPSGRTDFGNFNPSAVKMVLQRIY